ncbi:MAG: hypothetical protein MUE52_04880 [Tabrizicola sp.]|jgi:hypothetical protein|nr:hypothetical protein [Tabrizicola sp.]
MLLTDQPDSASALRLVDLGSLLDISRDLDGALARIVEDPLGYDLFVMECDAFGGLAGAETAIAKLIAADARMRVMLVGSDFDEPAYPLGRRTAVSLPAAVSDAAFRHGFDHVLRDRATVTLM